MKSKWVRLLPHTFPVGTLETRVTSCLGRTATVSCHQSRSSASGFCDELGHKRTSSVARDFNGQDTKVAFERLLLRPLRALPPRWPPAGSCRDPSGQSARLAAPARPRPWLVASTGVLAYQVFRLFIFCQQHVYQPCGLGVHLVGHPCSMQEINFLPEDRFRKNSCTPEPAR